MSIISQEKKFKKVSCTDQYQSSPLKYTHYCCDNGMWQIILQISVIYNKLPFHSWLCRCNRAAQFQAVGQVHICFGFFPFSLDQQWPRWALLIVNGRGIRDGENLAITFEDFVSVGPLTFDWSSHFTWQNPMSVCQGCRFCNLY